MTAVLLRRGLRELRQEGRWLPSLSGAPRSVAGTVAASLTVQACLLVSGIASARMLGVLDRGRLALFMLLASVLPVILTLGLPLSLTYWIAREPPLLHPLLRRLRGTMVYQLAALTLVHGIVLYVLYRNAGGAVQVAAALGLLSSPAMGLWTYGMAILQGAHDFRGLNISRLISPPITALLMFGYLLAGSHSLILATATWTVLVWLTALLTGWFVLRLPAEDQTSRREAPAIGSLYKFGFRGLLGSVTPLEGFQLDQAIVGVFMSQAALGLYVVGVSFTNLPRFISQAIGMVAYPNTAAASSQEETRRAIVRFTLMAIVLCGGAVVVLELGVPFLLPLLFGASFHAAIPVARILLISALLFALRRVLSESARGAGRPTLGSVAEVISLLTLFPAVALLYHSGAQGVATALVIAAAAGLIGIAGDLVLRRPAPAHERSGPDEPAEAAPEARPGAGLADAVGPYPRATEP